MKKLLFVAYSFPPVGASRSRRALFFSKYLAKEGWQLFVLTVKRPRVPDYDATLLKRIPPEVQVVRSSSWEPLRFSVGKFPTEPHRREETRWLRKVAHWIFCPDSRIGWIPFALWRGWRMITQEKIDAIMVIGEPFSSFLTGVFLKWITRRPLLLDFRDEWVPLNTYRAPEKPALILKLEEKLEAFVIRHADRITSVTPAIISHFKDRYPEFSKKFFYVPNGFDPEEYPLAPEKDRANGKWTVTYAGSLYEGRSPQYFFEALERLMEESPEAEERLRFIFLGTSAPSVESYFRRPLIQKVTERLGFISYAKTLEILCQSHLLLTIAEKDESFAPRYVPGKLLEYLGAGRYILALGGEGSVKEIIESTRTGCIVPARDVEKIKEALKERFEAYRRNALEVQANREAIACYQCQNTVRTLASLLESLTHRPTEIP
ncbi:MAG: glycosyltransferase [Candidatus Omnitrophica bacterium]|nr:glycosyltransferase [Candidatus Omnitrophota bacterium]